MFDFTTVLDRRGHDALAFDAVGRPGSQYPAPREGFDPIPMWVADMSFPIAPSILDAMRARLDHPCFGYFSPRSEYVDGILHWQRTHNGAADLEKKHLGYENGVLGGVATALSVLCSKGDAVLVHSPTYVGFTGVLTNNGYQIIHSPLVRDESGMWRMDFADMEEKLKKHRIHTAIFCSPHNPTGRVWERWEIERAMALYEKYGVTVISDEIWSDLILEGHRHIPTQSVSQDAKMRTVALYSPSKTFSLAGLVGSYHIIYNPMLKDRMDKEASLGHYNSRNVLTMHAFQGAYCTEGEQWLRELLAVLTRNAQIACRFFREKVEGVTVAAPQGTYMLFPDFAGWLESRGKTLDELLKAGWDVGVVWQDGRAFHGPTCIRLNLALPTARLEEALERLEKYVL